MNLWPSHLAGLDNVSGAWYAFWSGFGGRLTVIPFLIPLYRRHQCHVKRCIRLARHPVPDTPHRVCFRHSRFNAPTWKELQE